MRQEWLYSARKPGELQYIFLIDCYRFKPHPYLDDKYPLTIWTEGLSMI